MSRSGCWDCFTVLLTQFCVCVCVVLLQVFDQSALSNEAKEEMYKLYPNARRAHLKTGGNFPYLCRSAEVNLYIQVCVCVHILGLFQNLHSQKFPRLKYVRMKKYERISPVGKSCPS